MCVIFSPEPVLSRELSGCWLSPALPPAPPQVDAVTYTKATRPITPSQEQLVPELGRQWGFSAELLDLFIIKLKTQAVSHSAHGPSVNNYNRKLNPNTHSPEGHPGTSASQLAALVF